MLVIDTDGSIFKRSGGYWSCALYNSNKKLLQRFIEITGLDLTFHKVKKDSDKWKNLDVYYISFSGRTQIEGILNQIIKYLIVKKSKALLALKSQKKKIRYDLKRFQKK